MTLDVRGLLEGSGLLATGISGSSGGLPALIALMVGGVITGSLPTIRNRWIELSANRVFMLVLFFTWPTALAFEASVAFIVMGGFVRFREPGRHFWSYLASGIVAASLLRASLHFLPILVPWIPDFWCAAAAIPLVIVGDILVPHALTSRGGERLAIRAGVTALFYVPVVTLTLISSLLLIRGGDPGAVMAVVSVTGFSLLGRSMNIRFNANRDKVAALTEQSRLAARLMSSEASPDFLDLLENHLSAPGTDEVLLLTRVLEDGEWVMWSASGLGKLPAGIVPDDLPKGYGLSDPVTIDGRQGIAIDLSDDGAHYLFASGMAAGTILAMAPALLDNFLLLVRQTWEAVGHSMKSERSFLAAAVLLARLADSKDDYTHGHSLRVSGLSCALGEELGISPDAMRTLRVGAILHDLGKLAIPAEILTKRGLLTRQEREIIENHPAEGARIVSGLSGYEHVTTIIRSHHERLDGNGYPDRLTGDEVPFMARIVAVADTFDAITSTRTYHTITGRGTAMETIRSGRGTQYDARVVDALERIITAGEGPVV